jgi:hypothetical protein
VQAIPHRDIEDCDSLSLQPVHKGNIAPGALPHRRTGYRYIQASPPHVNTEIIDMPPHTSGGRLDDV